MCVPIPTALCSHSHSSVHVPTALVLPFPQFCVPIPTALCSRSHSSVPVPTDLCSNSSVFPFPQLCVPIPTALCMFPQICVPTALCSHSHSSVFPFPQCSYAYVRTHTMRVDALTHSTSVSFLVCPLGIGGTKFISFEDRHWHSECFVCYKCTASMVGRGFLMNGDEILCPECGRS